ncbi:MAG: hypothetical protein ABSH36_11935 [Solirubrobacteraceae bacterium]|jgi:hypothetical protein
MENLARSSNTPATDAAGELLTRIATDPANDGRYPDGTVLIPADSADTSKLIARAIDEHRPIALVFPDGSDVLARPPAHRGFAPLFAATLVRLADRLLRARDRPTFVPREWVTEFHAARVAGDPPRVVA